MAEIVGIFAATHAPPIVRDWKNIEAGRKARLEQAFLELGRRIGNAKPDVILAIGADHWANFFLDNIPAICIGVGTEHGGPPEAWLSDYPHPTMAGDPILGMHLANYAFAHDFEPSISHRLRLDHAFCIPIWKAQVSPLPPILPIIINAIQDPLPAISRCVVFGGLIADAIAAFEAPTRVVILATGGLSHSVGEPTMGQIDEAFDRDCIDQFKSGKRSNLIDYLTSERVARAGNGAAEVRFWAAAHGAARCNGFELFHYEAVPETYTGCGFAEWRRSTPAGS